MAAKRPGKPGRQRDSVLVHTLRLGPRPHTVSSSGAGGANSDFLEMLVAAACSDGPVGREAEF